MHKAKRTSHNRFEQVNLLCDSVLANLKTPTHAAVLLVGWRHADKNGIFRKSTKELARFLAISHRRMRQVLDDLIACGALKIVRRQQGTIPTYYRITGEPRGDAQFPAKPKARGDVTDS